MKRVQHHRVNFITAGAPDGDDGTGPIIHGKTVDEVIADIINTPGQEFLFLRFFAGYEEVYYSIETSA